MTHIEIFYSWQSDLPNKFNREFIRNCIYEAIQLLDASIISADIIFRVDNDTKGIYGSSDIAHTIFKNIENCHVFIGDVSIINSNAPVEFRRTPNPNVLIELGYAVSKIGWNNVILINNIAYSKVEEQPFDIRSRNFYTYNLSTENAALQLRLQEDLIRFFIESFYHLGKQYRPLRNNRITKDYGMLRKKITRLKVLIEEVLTESCLCLRINDYSAWDYSEFEIRERRSLVADINSKIYFLHIKSIEEDTVIYRAPRRNDNMVRVIYEKWSKIDIKLKQVMQQILSRREFFNDTIKLLLDRLSNLLNHSQFFTTQKTERIGVQASLQEYGELTFDTFDEIKSLISRLREQFISDYKEHGDEYKRQLQEVRSKK